MNKYEVMYVLDAVADDETIAAQIDRFTKIVTDNGGQVEKIDRWGRRRLAYPIDFKNDGYYVLMYMQAEPSLPDELERNFRISEEVMRFIVIRLEEKRVKKGKKPAPVAAPAAAPAPAPAPAEAPQED